MDSTEYNPEKKAMPIIGLILMGIGLIGFIVYITLDWFLKSIEPFSPVSWSMLIGIIVIVIIGAVLSEISKRRKYGTYKLVRVADILSWGFIIVLVISFILKFFIHF